MRARRHDDSKLGKRPVPDLLLDPFEEEGGPLTWPRITKSEQHSFDVSWRKLHRFLKQGKTHK
ncbi:MAG: hypothetical protein WBX11_13110 [Thiobacillaceae bacterium]